MVKSITKPYKNWKRDSYEKELTQIGVIQTQCMRGPASMHASHQKKERKQEMYN